ncbi:hypothetical protein B0T22DRAFT_381754 [Podospora appendiculata]|uniref:Zn(2)-C6 fungal-type domain-containing protein n=1 Tax=Podospora appendiculata TaxID=314037 RepID=A0AAE1CA81_9PEZI|nr:hypothetical protein B0T22DRAFT_381754 [Podospora appendiculata]
MTPLKNYQAIQPAPSTRYHPIYPGPNQNPATYTPLHPDHNSKSEQGSEIGGGSRRVLGKRSRRLKSVILACETCRRSKIRCDGVRPRCAGCVAKNKPCGYEAEEGQSRHAGMKLRLEALEKLVGALQSRPADEAELLLSQIRSADDIISLASSSSDTAKSLTGSSPAKSGSAATSLAEYGSQSDSSMSFPETTASLVPRSIATRESETPSITSTESGTFVEDSPSQVQVPAPPLAPRRVDPSAFLVRLIIPGAQLTRAAIQSFFSSSGKLFHVFTQPQVEQAYKSVFGGLDGRPNVSQKAAICCLCAVAAVGIQYNAGDFVKGAEEIFYEVAQHFFASAVEERPLEAIKICTLLAMYNIMNKATASLAYVEIGMSMSRRYSLNNGYQRPLSMTQDEWADGRRAWRTLMFFSSWLSSTLGYISANGDSTFQNLVPLAEGEVDHQSEIGEIVQAEMTKISLLNAEILRTHLASKELTGLAMDSAMSKLQQWHGSLPTAMLLANLGRQDLPDQVRRSIYHVHLLYLGAMMLLYRRIASQFVCTEPGPVSNFNQSSEDTCHGSTVLDLELHKNVLAHVHQGVVAARHSARILGLLLAEKGIFKRCWLVIFQAHTSCVVIMHSVAQKLLHNFPAASWINDLHQAQLCLDTLEFCGTIDPIAMRFHIRLSGIFDKLVNCSPRVSAAQTAMQRTEAWVTTMPPDLPCRVDAAAPETATMDDDDDDDDNATADYLLTVSPNPNPQIVALSLSLLFALCRPWGDRDDKTRASAAGSERAMIVQGVQYAGHAGGPAADYDHARGQGLPGRLQWELGDASLFQWDTSGMGLGLGMQEALSPCRFLGSEEPNGWSATADVEVDEVGDED